MISRTTQDFWELFAKLPLEIQEQAAAKLRDLADRRFSSETAFQAGSKGRAFNMVSSDWQTLSRFGAAGRRRRAGYDYLVLDRGRMMNTTDCLTVCDHATPHSEQSR